MSELSTYISSGPEAPRRSGAIGKPQAGRRVVILPVEGGLEPLPPGEQGLIAADRADPGLMLGYWKRPDEEASVYRGPWFTGGDLGVVDADGYFSHLGRANDLMNAQGYRVSPLEVEAALATMPGVAEVACAEVSVRDGVRVIAAFVVPQPEANLDAASVLTYANERLAAYKRPREIRFVEALPRTANGKVKRSALVTM
jgi:acyl-coenzyme A synthetase/AMP-(fatty) acid ligase